jgi:hypothetical protein
LGSKRRKIFTKYLAMHSTFPYNPLDLLKFWPYEFGKHSSADEERHSGVLHTPHHIPGGSICVGHAG